MATATPLSTVALRAHIDGARCLLELWASVHAKDCGGATALQAAGRSGAPELMRLLSQSGAQVTTPHTRMARHTALPLPVRCVLSFRIVPWQLSPAAKAAMLRLEEEEEGRALLLPQLEELARAHSDAWGAKLKQFSPLAQRLLVLNEEPSCCEMAALFGGGTGDITVALAMRACVGACVGSWMLKS